MIETTAIPGQIEAACERVADLGTVVLGGPGPGSSRAHSISTPTFMCGDLTVIGVRPVNEGAA